MKKLFIVLPLILAACGGKTTDPDTYAGWTLEALSAHDGVSVRIPEFDVKSGEDRQDCFFINAPDVNNGQDYWINEVKTAINPGSHHMNVFRVKTLVNLRPENGTPIMLGDIPATVVNGGFETKTSPCWLSANWADWPLVANSQNSEPNDPYTDWKLPIDKATNTQVALKITPGEPLMIQTHYVNATVQSTPFKGKVGINFYRYNDAKTPVEMGTLFATQQHIRVCQSNPTPKYTGTCRFPPGSTTITAANGHFHARGKQFDMFTWDGQSENPTAGKMFYQSAAWNDPPMLRDLDEPVASGGGIAWTCEYQWQPPEGSTCDVVNARDDEHAGDCCYTFGGPVSASEHCNVFLYYYPRLNSDRFCN